MTPLRFRVLAQPAGAAPPPLPSIAAAGTIGRSEGNTLVLPDPGALLSRQHCRLEPTPGGWQVVDLSSNGTFVNDMLIGRGNVRPVVVGDRLRLGDWVLALEGPGGGASAPAIPSPMQGEPDPLDPFGIGDISRARPAAPAPAALPPRIGAQDPIFGATADPFGGGAANPFAAGNDAAAPSDPFGMPGGGFPGAGAAPAPGGFGAPLGGGRLPPGPPVPDVPSALSGGGIDSMSMPLPMPPGQGFGAPPPAAPGGLPSGGLPDDWLDDALAGLGPKTDPIPASPAPPPSPPPAALAPQPVPPAPPQFAAPPFPPQPPAAPPQFASPPFPPHPPAAPTPAMPAALADAVTDPFAPPDVLPPPPPAPVAPPAMAPLRAAAPMPAAGPGNADAGLLAFAQGAGISPPSGIAAEAGLQELGRSNRLLARSLMRLLAARRAVKSEFRISQTVVAASENNPLKFSADEAELVTLLLGVSRPGFQSGSAAVADAARDLQAHQVALLAAFRAVIAQIFARLDPQAIGGKEDDAGLLGRLTGSAKGAAWDRYVQVYGDMKQDFSESLRGRLAQVFAEAYESESQRHGGS